MEGSKHKEMLARSGHHQSWMLHIVYNYPDVVLNIEVVQLPQHAGVSVPMLQRDDTAAI